MGFNWEDPLLLEQQLGDEERMIRVDPAGEAEEIRQIFRLKGFDGEALEAIVEGITANREQWIRTMLTEEFGLPLQVRAPVRAATRANRTREPQ